MEEPPRDAIFSGYFMNYTNFQKLASGLNPEFAEHVLEYGETSYIFYVTQYDDWRRELERDERVKAPRLKLFHDPELSNEDEVDADSSKFFFWTRYVPAPDGSSMDDFPQMTSEEEVDRARRDELIALIQAKNNFLVDKTCLQFGCFKDYHPWHDPLKGF